MRKVYRRPEMVAYGDLRFVTQGSSGVSPDLDINKNFEIIGPDNNPTCTTNVTVCFNLLSV